MLVNLHGIGGIVIFIGAFLLVLVAFMVWREYDAYLKRSLRELSEFVVFIKNMRDRME